MTETMFAKYRPPSVELCAEECGAKCCKSGLVWLTEPEAQMFKDWDPHFDIKKIQIITEDVDHSVWLLDHRKFGQCPFLIDNLCSIYEKRPNACRRFPTKPTVGCLVFPESYLTKPPKKVVASVS